jgi:hypothetical protein
MKDQTAPVVLSEMARRLAIVIGVVQYLRRGWHQSRQPEINSQPRS